MKVRVWIKIPLSRCFPLPIIISKRSTLNEKGTGLGLKLCKEFVEKNNGRIWVEVNEPRGSVF